MALAACGGGKEEAAPPPPAATPTPAPPAPVVTAPSISTQPAAATVAAGASASFSVTASGTAPFTYQWQRNGTAISGATAASYSFNATEADSGAEFRVVVSNSAGSVTSSAAVLTVQPVVIAPTIAVAPQSLATLDGGTATFVVVAEGTGPFTYVWQRNGTAIANATAATYTTPELALADSGARYRVVVTNSAGSITSAEATLTVNPVAPAIATAPASVAVTAGQTATFSASATGSAPLAYQWQRNGTAVAGATSASYTTPATTVADNGARYRVVVSNAAGSVTSAEATLGVTAAVIAPAITTAPAGATVQEGQTATFTAAASGTAPLAYQWLRNGTAISGATSASYTTAATTVAADNGARFSVRVSNAAGSVTSNEVVLTVNAAVNGLVGRAWSTGQALETGANTIETFRSGIDDNGNAVVVFAQDNGSRIVLYAVHGSPNAAGTAPTWTAPVVIDTAGSTAYTLPVCVLCERPYVRVAPNGNAVAMWPSNLTCTSTNYRTSGTCQTFFVADYDANARTWSQPVRAVDTPTNSFGGNSIVKFNNRGDLAFLYLGWVRDGSSNFTPRLAVAWRAAGQSTFRNYVFNVSQANLDFDMDEAGNMTVAGTLAQNATVDFVAYRANVSASTFGPQEIIDARSSSATGDIGVRVGRNGQIMTFYTQNNGTANRLFAATATSATAPFTVVDLAAPSSSFDTRLVITDDGIGRFHYGCNAYTWSASGDSWSGPEALPGNCQVGAITVARNGNSLGLSFSSGLWSTYARATNSMVRPLPSSTTGQPAEAFVYGVASSLRRSLNGRQEWSLSPSGVGLFVTSDTYDVLPTAGSPNGDGRPSILNLWGVYLK